MNSRDTDPPHGEPSEDRARDHPANAHGHEPHGPSQAGAPHDHGSHEHCDHECIVTVNGMTIDLCRTPLVVSFRGFRVAIDHPCDQAPPPPPPFRQERIRGYNVLIPDIDPQRPTGGEVLIEGKPLPFEFNPSLGRFTTHVLFGGFPTVRELVQAFIKANPNLRDELFEHGHGGTPHQPGHED